MVRRVLETFLSALRVAVVVMVAAFVAAAMGATLTRPAAHSEQGGIHA